MPAETITLTQDQAEDLRELLSHAEILEDWLLHASDDILDKLARFAYYGHFHPYSAAWWLIEDLGHLRCRLRKTLPGHHHEQDRPAVAHSIKAIAETGTSPTASSCDGLDTATSIGNHKPIMIATAAPLPGHPSDLHQQPHGHELQLPYGSECKGMAIFHYVSDVR